MSVDGGWVGVVASGELYIGFWFPRWSFRDSPSIELISCDGHVSVPLHAQLYDDDDAALLIVMHQLQ